MESINGPPKTYGSHYRRCNLENRLKVGLKNEVLMPPQLNMPIMKAYPVILWRDLMEIILHHFLAAEELTLVDWALQVVDRIMEVMVAVVF